ncbi:putative sigma-adaptin 3, putative,adaptor complex AP-3 small subunit [Trypanosoma conorhini]|uniref:Putative sigma-adaptin 3, putative,adaptor complex AP-3 small subunit n=1 Tax=Trypanosoma conorhini TaxID=83891 RepID=A0A3R7N584_9TRYP|nr:putative sigma-adaptin 3, putative,adaptor complex AP-3 small subunit [Trypanosoma conorhini]RNF12984.1 putative sigma-adaptin 3, putative,adaptor complex AP-3 small subunit [Trypanosoma conorhini]
MPLCRGVDTERDSLPLTVEELVESYQHTRQLNEELCAFIDNIRVGCNSIAENSPHATQALRELLAAASRGSTAVASPIRASQVNGSGVSSKGPGSTCTVAAGDVLEGVVVKGKMKSEVSEATAKGSTKSRFLRFVEEAKHDYKEECGVLRVKLLAMESGQKLLLQAQQKLREQEKKTATCVSALEACRNELAAVRSQCSLLVGVLNDGEVTAVAAAAAVSPVQHVIQQASDRNAPQSCECDGLTTQAEPAAATGDSLRSLTARLVQTEMDLQKSQAAAKSLQGEFRKLEYGNGQLNERLETLTAERDALQLHNRQLEGQLHRLLSLLHDHPESRQAMHAGEGADAVAACRAEEEAERVKLRESVQRLRCENRALQNSVLQLQRQVNDSELRTEEMYSAGNEDVLQLKEDMARLREALRERQFALEQTRCDGKRAATQWELLDKVHRTVIHHISTRLVCEVSRQFVPSSLGDTSATTPAPNPTAAARAQRDEAASVSDAVAAQAPETGELQEAVTAVVVEPFCSQASNDTRVQELLSRLEAKESEHRLALKHWQQVNQELRSALANSQEELKQWEARSRALERAKSSSVAHATTPSQRGVAEIHGACTGDDSARDQTTLSREHASIFGGKQMSAENEAHLRLVVETQRETSSNNAILQDSRWRCATVKRGDTRNLAAVNVPSASAAASSAMTHLSSGAVDLSSAFPIRNLQRMLHDVLQENLTLAARVKELEAR